jgi:hypothetical protein
MLLKYNKPSKSYITSPQENFKVEYFDKYDFNKLSKKTQGVTLRVSSLRRKTIRTFTRKYGNWKFIPTRLNNRQKYKN